jgi:dTMP kinase|tara:strand:+ start:111 stop:728 length:618 start_codon:yes stop_codon:yes gene_type:complete
MKGKFITIEGSEGVGKTTNINFIVDYLTKHNRCILETREPGGTAAAEEIRNILLNSNGELIPDIAELLLFFAARSLHLENVILPALVAGKFVICDRFTDATIAYQGYGRGFDLERINNIAQWVHADIQPDLTILLDAPAEIGMQRAKKRGAIDRMESEEITFYERVREGYLQLAEQYNDRFVVIDANQSLDLVQKAIMTHLEDLI